MAFALTLAITVPALRVLSGAADERSTDSGSEGVATLATLEQTLQTAGASSPELAIFEGWVKGMSQDELTEFADFVDKNPSNLVRLLRREVKEEQAPAPEAIFQNVAPAMPCSALQKVPIAETTIDSWSISPSDGSCRITATVIHPPADNHIKEEGTTLQHRCAGAVTVSTLKIDQF